MAGKAQLNPTRPRTAPSLTPLGVRRTTARTLRRFGVSRNKTLSNGCVPTTGSINLPTRTISNSASQNPSVKSDCSGIKVGNSYCIEVNYGIPPTPTTTAAPSSTAAPKPTQTQYGLIDSCTEFYEAKSGDICVSIASSFGTFTWPDFLLWNPAVGDDCSRLYAGWYYCVDAPERAPTPTSVVPVETCNPTAPTPTQPGPICGCTKWYQVEEGDTCSVIINKFDLGENFYKWNSNFGSQCEYLYLGYYVCIGVE